MRLSKVINDLIQIENEIGDTEVSVRIGNTDCLHEITEIYMSCAESVVICVCEITDVFEDKLNEAKDRACNSTRKSSKSDTQGDSEDSKDCDLVGKQRIYKTEEYIL